MCLRWLQDSLWGEREIQVPHIAHAALAKGSQGDSPLGPLQVEATKRTSNQENILHCPKISVKHIFQGLKSMYLSLTSTKLSI